MTNRESKASEDYHAFNLLRSRFGSAKKAQQPSQRKEKRRRRDPRFEAPPLKPLVEEGDLSAVSEVSREDFPESSVSASTSCNRNCEIEVSCL